MKTKTAIIGTGNIGTDLMIKILRNASHLEMAAFVGIDPKSDGLARAKSMGIATTDAGLSGLQSMDCYSEIGIVFDATSAGAHVRHAQALRNDGKTVIDLTPAAIGPYVVPPINLDEHLRKPNINMVTCGGQATIPIVHAVRRVCDRVPYAEIVASIASKSAGPGTRENIDEFTEITSRAIEGLGGADRGKAIIILNPAEPPMVMRDTVFTLSQGGDKQEIRNSVEAMVKEVQHYVPGYRLKQELQFEEFGGNREIRVPGMGVFTGMKTTIFLEVEGAAHYLPAYAGNLDIMTSAALATGDRVASHMHTAQIGAV